MMTLKPLAFLDSGIGGLPYLAHLRQSLPNAPFIYVADNRNFPYGKKTEDEVRWAAMDMTTRMLRHYDPALVVVACNTASLHALSLLRASFPLEFVGVVPAVKPASAASRSRVVGVMATERALQGSYFDHLVEEFGNGCRIVRFAATALIQAIETDPFMEDKAGYIRLMEEIRGHFRSQGVDTIVLGCTHFLHLNQQLLDVFGKEFTIFDSREGVSQQTLRLLRGQGVLDQYATAKVGQNQSVFHLTAPLHEPGIYPRVAEAFDLGYGGALS